MSTHYLVSVFDNKIKNVLTPDVNGKTTITGNYVIRVPNDCVVQNPTSVNNLLTQKYASMLASHGLFSAIVYDDMLDDTGVDTGSSSQVILGDNGTNALYADGGVLTSTTSSFGWGGVGDGPAQALVLFEVYRYEDSVVDGLYVRKYVEDVADLASIDCEVSFNGGSTWIACANGTLITIPLVGRGSDVVVRFSHSVAASNPRLGLGSWAILF